MTHCNALQNRHTVAQRPGRCAPPPHVRKEKRPVSRILFLIPLALLAACGSADLPDLPPGVENALGIAPELPPGPPPLPAAVAAVLPPGTNPALVFEDGNGCYLFSVEVTDPPSGFPVRDANGNQICEGQPAAVPATSDLTDLVIADPEPGA